MTDLHFLQCFSVLLLLPIALSSSSPYHPREHFFINCGGPPSSQLSSSDGVQWTSDEEPPLSLSPANTTTATITTSATRPFDSARIFSTPLNYSFSVSPGPKLLRLYFSPNTSYNKIDATKSLISVTANGFDLLRNFSAYLAVANAEAKQTTAAPAPSGQLVREFHVTVVGDFNKNLELVFFPSNGSAGFINGIELISVPDGLYVPVDLANQSEIIPYIIGGSVEQNSGFNFPEPVAMETMIRLNIGGTDVGPSDDSGLGRFWFSDDHFINAEFRGFTVYDVTTMINYTKSTPAYTAPINVYGTMRRVGPYFSKNKLTKNLTWILEVDAGFNYFLRLHFCELVSGVNKTGQVDFRININSQTIPSMIDVFGLMGNPGTPMYMDFVTYVDGHGSKVNLPIALLPYQNSIDVDAFLNGLEIFKLSDSNRSLAASNPNVIFITPPSAHETNRPKNRHLVLVLIIIGGSVGFILLSIAAFVFMFIYCRKEKKDEVSALDSTKSKWQPVKLDDSHSSTANTATTTSSVASSLPSDLCRCFSLPQIRIATSDFDDSAVIGSGGFGKVYKGSIDNGATLVAIKRLNPTSNQGAREFRNEIEMLSKLRHVHLVSLIGYCQDDEEMILVYNYMPRGTLRDHLMYKSNSRMTIDTPLSWKQRLMICVGSAKGLHYLHAGTNRAIIHRDVKSTNILLDDRWNAKVSDFGLSKVGPASDAGVDYVSTAVKGSVGYLDPEYYRLHQLTDKSDVYSFGVVLFEVLCARPAINPSLPKDQVNLALWARSHYRCGTLDAIVDPNLSDQISAESLRKYGEVAEMCVRDNGCDRPPMGDVMWGLEFALQLQLTADQKNGSIINGTTADKEVSTASGDNMSPSGRDKVRSVNSTEDGSA